IGEGCYNSLGVIGTSNIPVSNGRDTSVVNIWAYVANADAKAAAWVYKNAAGQYWAQIDHEHVQIVRSAFPKRTADALLRGATTEMNSIPYRISAADALDLSFKKAGIYRQPCFTKDFPASAL
ncbi:MAG TPA: hypothetical protein VFN49_07780, partial [Candidatus Aquilonibacter sp.]|nr:hypothetical protein [Candidatus Aquilonibacter sp.]